MDFYQNCIWYIFYKLEIYLGLILIYNISIDKDLLYSHLWIWPVCEDSMFPFCYMKYLLSKNILWKIIFMKCYSGPSMAAFDSNRFYWIMQPLQTNNWFWLYWFLL